MPLNSVPASQRKPGFHEDPASEGWPYKPLEGWTYETHNPKMKGNLWAVLVAGRVKHSMQSSSVNGVLTTVQRRPQQPSKQDTFNPNQCSSKPHT